jgi:hypothetical protein
MLAGNDAAAGYGEIQPAQGWGCPQYFTPDSVPAQIRIRRGRSHLKESAINIENKCTQSHVNRRQHNRLEFKKASSRRKKFKAGIPSLAKR